MAYESLDFLDVPTEAPVETPVPQDSLSFLDTAETEDTLAFLDTPSENLKIIEDTGVKATLDDGIIVGATKGIIQSIPESMDNTYSTLNSLLPESVSSFLEETDKRIVKMFGGDDEDYEALTAPDLLSKPTQEFTGELNTAGEISKDISKVILSFALTSRFKPVDLGKLQTIGVNTLRAAPGDLLFWSKDDKHLTDIASEHDIQWAVVNYLKSDPNDSAWEHNLKGAIENGLLGSGLELAGTSMLRGYVGLRSWFHSTGKSQDVINEVVDTIASEPIVAAVTPKSIKQGVNKPPKTQINYNKNPLNDQPYTEALLNSKTVQDAFNLDVKPRDLTEIEAKEVQALLGRDGLIELSEEVAKKTKDLDVMNTALRRELYDISTDMKTYKKAALETTGVEQQKAVTKWLLSMEQFNRMAPNVKGTQTAIARTQSAMNIFAFDDKALRATMEYAQDHPENFNKVMDDILSKNPMSDDNVKLALKAMSDIEAGIDVLSAGKNAIKGDSVWVKGMRVMLENMYNGILSNPVTHKINMMGNLTSSTARMAEHYGASIIGHGKAAINKVTGGAYKGGTDFIKVSELAALHRGHLSGIWDTYKGISAAIKNLPEGVASFEESLQKGFLTNVGKLDEDTTARYLSAEYLGVKGGAGYVVDVAGGVNRAALNLLGIEDDMFKRMAYNSHANYMAVREANKRGVKAGVDKEQFVKDFINVMEMQTTIKNGGKLSAKGYKLVRKMDPTNSHYDEAILQAKEITFQEDLGKAGQDFVKFKKDAFGGAGNLIMPFVKTPTNLIKWLVRRTPCLNAISSKSRAMWAKGGRDRDIVLAQLTLGSSLYGLAYNMYQDNKIVGMAPEGLRQTYESAGLLESSYLTEDGYSIQYNRADPIASFFNITAAMGQFYDDMQRRGVTDDEVFKEHWDEASFAFISAFSENTLNKTYTQGVKELLRAMDNPTPEKWKTYLDQKALMMAPFSGTARWMNEESDDNRKAAITLVEKAMNLYGMRDDLPYQPDEYGKFSADIKFQGLKMKKISTSPIRQELVKLGIRLPRMGKEVSYKGIPIELNTKELSDMRHLLESEFQVEQQLNDMVTGYDYQNTEFTGLDWAKPGTKKGMLIGLLNTAHNEALESYMESHPKVVAKYREAYNEKVGLVQANRPSRVEEYLKKAKR